MSGRLGWLAAEFLIVVMGVASGLAVDEWREGRQDAREEQQYLAGLQADLAADTLAYRRSSELARARGVTIASGLGRLFDPMLSPADMAAVLDELSFALNQTYPQARTDTYEQLLAQGGLSQIGSPELQASLTAYYADVERRQALYDGWEEWRRALEIRAMEVLPSGGYAFMVGNGRIDPAEAMGAERAGSVSPENLSSTVAAIRGDDMIRSLFVRSRVTHGRLSGTSRNQAERVADLLGIVESELSRFESRRPK